MSDATQFVVSLIEWAPSQFARDKYLRRTQRALRAADFATFDEADADRARREADYRRRAGVNPFLYGGEALFYQTSLDAPRLHDWLMDAGIEPPVNPNGHSAWVAWWEQFAPTWTAEQLAHAWAALDKVRFYEVTEEHPAQKAYVIVELNWLWEDEPTLQADYEGGNAVRAFRSRANAEAECDRLNRERQAQERHNSYSFFTRSTRAGSPDTYSLDISKTIFFEVVEIELGGDA